MFKELKNQFMQVAFLTVVWVLLLLSIFKGVEVIKLLQIWNLIGIGIISGLVFGVVYPFVWEYSTWKATVNIVLTTLLNTLAGYCGLYLFSIAMFQMVLPYWWGVLALTLIGHIIAFYFYRRYQNNKIVNELNELNK